MPSITDPYYSGIYSPFSLFTVVTSSKVHVNTEFLNTEPLFLVKIKGEFSTVFWS